jgi:hypothetical protein
MLDVAVRMMKDATGLSDIHFTVGGLHASEPTVLWVPQSGSTDVDVDVEFERIAQRLEGGIDLLEGDAGLPDWMTDATARALHHASGLFGETAIDGLAFARGRSQKKLTRQTYRTLDRVSREESDAIGSITGVLVTCT